MIIYICHHYNKKSTTKATNVSGKRESNMYVFAILMAEKYELQAKKKEITMNFHENYNDV